MSNLKTNLEQILQEKETKIIPENIKKDVEILGVTGTYEGSSSSDNVAKIFETEEAMQADTNAQEGDLALVYKSEIQNMTADSQTQFITFPEAVTLPSAITESYYCMLRSIDSSAMFDGQIRLTSTMFRFNGYSETGMIEVQYESGDGINYTRTTEVTNPIDLGTAVHIEMAEEWNDTMGYFMQIGGNVFKGLFKCNNIPNPDTVSAYKFYKYIEEDGERIPDKEDTEFTKEEVTLFKECMENSSFDSYRTVLIKDLDTEEYYVVNMSAAVLLTSEKAYICGIPPRNDEESVNFNNALYKVNTNTKTLEKVNTTSSITAIQGDDCWFGCPLPNMNKIQISKVGYPDFEESDVRYYANNNQYVNIDLPPRTNILKYEFVSSQLTTTVDKVYNSIYYGKDGVNEGTLTSAPANTLDDTNAEVYYKLMQFYDNMEPIKVQNGQTFKNAYFITNSYGDVLLDLSEVTNASNMFSGNKHIVECPELNTSNVTNTTFMFNECTNLISAPEMDTSNVTAMNFMFAYDTNLGVVPAYDTSKVTTMNNMFYMSPNLSDEALNNIMQMCINTTDKYTGNKTLSALSISSELATKCTTLSNYQAFTEAGWTTGY